MKTNRIALALAALVAGCPAPASNPPRLWLALNGDELHVQLVPVEPNPF